MYRPEDRYDGRYPQFDRLDPDEKKWEESKQTAKEGERQARIQRLVRLVSGSK